MYKNKKLQNDNFSSLEFSKDQNIDISNDINIFLGAIHQESLCLAKALYELKQNFSSKINIVLTNPDNLGFCVFDGENFINCLPINSASYTNISEVPSVIYGNSIGFDKYGENKALAGIILGQNNINIPKQIFFSQRHNLKSLGKEKFEKFILDKEKFVLKPSNGKCGTGVKIFDKSEICADFYDKNIKNNESLVLQERIESYPLHINSIKKDWNLRVLVTFDAVKNKYISAGMIGRIGNYGEVINISQNAEYISFEDLSKLIGLDKLQSKKLKKNLYNISTKSVNAISKRFIDNKTNFQTISGVDIILDKNLIPFVIEVNPATSGGMYKLSEYYGIDSIYPIAYSILNKIYIYSDLIEQIIKNKNKA